MLAISLATCLVIQRQSHFFSQPPPTSGPWLCIPVVNWVPLESRSDGISGEQCLLPCPKGNPSCWGPRSIHSFNRSFPLQSTFKRRYHEVISNCYHLCIPRNGSYDPKQLNDKLIMSHILKPSPLLKSYVNNPTYMYFHFTIHLIPVCRCRHFLPYNSKQNFHVQIDQNYIRVTKGFGDQNQTRIRILNEEKAYNSVGDLVVLVNTSPILLSFFRQDNKSYSIFICESPLISSLNCKLNYETLKSSSHDVQLASFEEYGIFIIHYVLASLMHTISLGSCQNFLTQISLNELNALKCKITQLLKTYIILPDYIEDVSLRLKRIIDLSIDSFAVHYNKLEKYRKCRELLSSVIER